MKRKPLLLRKVTAKTFFSVARTIILAPFFGGLLGFVATFLSFYVPRSQGYSVADAASEWGVVGFLVGATYAFPFGLIIAWPSRNVKARSMVLFLFFPPFLLASLVSLLPANVTLPLVASFMGLFLGTIGLGMYCADDPPRVPIAANAQNSINNPGEN